MDLNTALSLIAKGIGDELSKNGFSAVRPEGVKSDELPLFTNGEHSYLDYTGKKGKIRVELFENQALLFYTDVKPEEAADEDLKKASANLFELENADDRDIKSLCNEFNETVRDVFGSRAAATKASKKMPAPVSKSAAKSGALSYDGNTLANRLTTMYPELKDAYRANFEKYGEFLAEEFFTEHANAAILTTIRQNDKLRMNKLFKILNDIYENGSNDVQGLVAVTVLGAMENDKTMCQNAAEYMCDDLKDTVLLVNKYLASASGKRAQKKLLNPPPYKPKKQKKPGMFQQMMSGGMPQQ